MTNLSMMNDNTPLLTPFIYKVARCHMIKSVKTLVELLRGLSLHSLGTILCLSVTTKVHNSLLSTVSN